MNFITTTGVASRIGMLAITLALVVGIGATQTVFADNGMKSADGVRATAFADVRRLPTRDDRGQPVQPFYAPPHNAQFASAN